MKLKKIFLFLYSTASLLALLTAVSAGNEFAGTHVTRTDSYEIRFSLNPSAPLVGQVFSIVGRIKAQDAAKNVVRRLTVDAAMPQHGHGMTTKPTTSVVSDEFITEGMLFHMQGAWQIYFDIYSGNVIERAIYEYRTVP